MQPNQKLLPTLRATIRLRQFSPRTEEAYVGWVKRFVRFHDLTPPTELGERDVLAFLTHLAVERKVAPSTLAQALAALCFLYREVLRRPLSGIGRIPQIKAPQRLPVVLTQSEVRLVLEQLGDRMWLIGMLLYGSGLRLMECLTLRVKDVDLERGEIRIRRGKGAKDRVTMISDRAREPLTRQLAVVTALHDRDLADGAGWVPLPGALGVDTPTPGARLPGSGCFRPGAGIVTRQQARSVGTTCTNLRFSVPSPRPSAGAVSGSVRAVILSATPSPPTFWKQAMTSGPSRNSWATGTCQRR